MHSWIFQGNPDKFDIDGYLGAVENIRWLVRQRHFIDEISPGDEVFLWKAAGKQKATSGVVAQAVITSHPKELPDDPESIPFWKTEEGETIEPRVNMTVQRVRTRDSEALRSRWLEEDPILHDLRIFKMRSETNYRLTPNQGQRLASLFRNTGRNWTREESLAAMWAYDRTYGQSISRGPDSPVTKVSLLIGRVVTGVYNKVMDFRAIDPRDERTGLPAGSHVDAEIWEELYDAESESIDSARLESEFSRLWGGTATPGPATKPIYSDFGDAPNDDPEELQQFAKKVRRGQREFRKNLLAAYGKRCCISGWGPPSVLEAVHIVSHAESGINELDNGLLLRSDLHSLFDDHLIWIDPDNLAVAISEELKESEYSDLAGKTLRTREDGSQPDPKYLVSRYKGS